MKGSLAMHQTPMHRDVKAIGEAMPSAGSDRLDRLSLSWRTWWWAEGRPERGVQTRPPYDGGGSGTAGLL